MPEVRSRPEVCVARPLLGQRETGDMWLPGLLCPGVPHLHLPSKAGRRGLYRWYDDILVVCHLQLFPFSTPLSREYQTTNSSVSN